MLHDLLKLLSIDKIYHSNINIKANGLVFFSKGNSFVDKTFVWLWVCSSCCSLHCTQSKCCALLWLLIFLLVQWVSCALGKDKHSWVIIQNKLQSIGRCQCNKYINRFLIYFAVCFKRHKLSITFEMIESMDLLHFVQWRWLKCYYINVIDWASKTEQIKREQNRKFAWTVNPNNLPNIFLFELGTKHMTYLSFLILFIQSCVTLTTAPHTVFFFLLLLLFWMCRTLFTHMRECYVHIRTKL